MKGRTCLICGCTDFNCTNCVEKTGEPCYWISDKHNFCSACLHIALDLAENFLFIMRKNEKDFPEEIARMIKLNYITFQEKIKNKEFYRILEKPKQVDNNPTSVQLFKVFLSSDFRKVIIKVYATDETSAIDIIMKSEKCPRSAITKVEKITY